MSRKTIYAKDTNAADWRGNPTIIGGGKLDLKADITNTHMSNNPLIRNDVADALSQINLSYQFRSGYKSGSHSNYDVADTAPNGKTTWRQLYDKEVSLGFKPIIHLNDNVPFYSTLKYYRFNPDDLDNYDSLKLIYKGKAYIVTKNMVHMHSPYKKPYDPKKYRNSNSKNQQGNSINKINTTTSTSKIDPNALRVKAIEKLGYDPNQAMLDANLMGYATPAVAYKVRQNNERYQRKGASGKGSLSYSTPAVEAKLMRPTRTANTVFIATTLICPSIPPIMMLNPSFEANNNSKSNSLISSYLIGTSPILTDAEAAIINTSRITPTPAPSSGGGGWNWVNFFSGSLPSMYPGGGYTSYPGPGGNSGNSGYSGFSGYSGGGNTSGGSSNWHDYPPHSENVFGGIPGTFNPQTGNYDYNYKY